MTFEVLATDGVSADGLGPLLDDPRFSVHIVTGSAAPEFGEVLPRCHALIVRSATKVDEALLERAPALRVVGRAGVGVDNIDVGGASVRGIAVFNAPDASTTAAAELTMALILSLVRRLTEADRSLHDGRWERSRFQGIELRGRTLGLIGAGRIGVEVARRCQAFGMEVVAYDPYLDDEALREQGITPLGLDDVVSTADVVSLHVPLTEATRGLIGAERLSRMKQGAFLVNASRGGVVDEEALVDALHSGHLGGAAIDVYETEPVKPDHRLLSAPRTVLTPHLGASTQEAQLGVAVEVATAIRSALLDGDISRAVNAGALRSEA